MKKLILLITLFSILIPKELMLDKANGLSERKSSNISKGINFDRQNNSEESTISLQILNTSSESIKVKAIEKIVGDWVIKESSSMYIKDDASTIYFPLEIQPNSSELITYTYRKEWK